MTLPLPDSLALGALAWRGETVIIVAGGPSASAVNLAAARGRARFIAVNDSWRLCPWADVLYACDPQWWDRKAPPPEAFAGVRVTEDLGAARKHGLRRVVVTRGVNRILTDHAGVIGSGGNGGFQALNIAVQAGAAKVILVGFDMRIDRGLHWHGPHPSGMNNPKPPAIDIWIRALDGAAPRLQQIGVAVVNASPVSALQAFAKMTLEEALDGERAQPDLPARRDLVA